MPIGHISLPTGPSTFKQLQTFYLAILKPLGYTIYLENHPRLYGMASSAGPDFWLHCEDTELPKLNVTAGVKPVGKIHVAFNAESREMVDGWYRIAMFVMPSVSSN
jgi:predicted GTPase